MALIYGLMRSLAVALCKIAAWRHKRAQSQFDKLDSDFRKAETECKAEEVHAGRPADLVSQIRLLKQYEKREEARQKWIAAANKLNKRKKLEKRIVGFNGRKIPYSFGLIDMALVMRIAEVGFRNGFQWSHISDFFAKLI